MATEDTSARICRDAVDMVGHTPLVYLNKVAAGLPARVGECIDVPPTPQPSRWST